MERPTEISAPSEIQPSGINYGDLFAKAMAMEDTPAEPEAPKAPVSDGIPSIADVAAKVAEKTEHTQETEHVAVPEKEAVTETAPREFQDNDLVKVKVDGKEEVVTYKDFKDGIQREKVFTQRMQTLAAQRQQAEQEISNRYAQLYQYAQSVALAEKQLEQNNPLARLAQQLEQKKTAEQDPNTLATIGEIQKALSEHRTQVTEEFAKREQAQREQLAMAAQQLRAQAAQAADATKFTSALNEALSQKDFQVLKSVVPSPELAESIIRYNVAQMGPETIDQGIDYMKTFVKQWADNVKAQQKQDNGRTEAVKARAVIEPPTGSPPAPRVVNKPDSFFKKDGGLDWNTLHERAKAMLET